MRHDGTDGGPARVRRLASLALVPLCVMILATAFAAGGLAAPAAPDPPAEEAAAPATTAAPPEEAPVPTTTEGPPTTVETTEPPPPSTEPPPPSTEAPPPVSTIAPTTTAGAPPTTAVEEPPPDATTTEPERTVAGPTSTTEPDRVILVTPDPTNTISIDKTNTADGEPAGDDTTVQPGESYTYNFLASCSNITVNCVNLTVVDTFPADVIVDESTICADVPGLREVTYDSGTRAMTIVYVEPLTNPPGTTGKLAGTSDTCNVSVTLPADTPLEDGDTIANEATISADNVAESATDPSDVIVEVPVTVDAGASKSFSDPSAIAGDTEATTTIELGGTNQSSNSATVNEMVIEESTPATFEYLDVTSVTVTQFPTGAEQAQVFVCPEASAPCDESEWVAGGTSTGPGPLALPDPPPSEQIVGVRVVFTADEPAFIENVAGTGTVGVDIEMDLRDTVRSTDQPIVEIPETTIIDNTATVTVTDPGGPGQDPQSDTASANAEFQILPPTLSLDISKSFIPDDNGNFNTDGGEHAVIGENSGASMIMDATNTSAFPIAEITITEPSPDVASEFAKFDADSILLEFPAGADSATVEVTFEDGSTSTFDSPYEPPGPTTVDLPDTPRATSITVTYAGPDDDGDGEPDPTIEPGATAGLNVHGNLNAGVDESDLTSGVDNCAHMNGSGGGVPGTTGEFTGNACDVLPIEERNPDAGGTKTNSQNQIPVGQTIVFQMTTTNNGNLTLFDLVVADPPLDAAGNPPTPDESSVFYWGQLTPPGVTVTPAAMAGRVTVEVFTDPGGWQPFEGFPETSYPDVTGVRGTIDELEPTETFTFNVFMTSRDPLPPGTPPETLTNCYQISADTSAGGDEFVAEEHCSNPISPGPVDEAAAINKAIAPQTVPERIPGMDPADAQARVTLTVVNDGSITARTLQITDNDADFWDAVDFVGFASVTPPAVGELDRADRLQVDAFVDPDGAGPSPGTWVNGVPAAPGSPALPAGVTNAQVRGLRFTFSDTSTVNDGFVLTPCLDNSCAGIVEFDIVPRLSLLSTGGPLPDVDPADGVPDQLLDTATGAATTRLHPNPADPLVIPPVADDLNFRPGDPALDVNKGPEAVTLVPGQFGTFTLTTTNTGTANLPDLTISDPLPTGILFDDTFAGDGGQPFTVNWENLPEGYPEPPEAVFETTPDPADPSRVGLLRWTFPGWPMPPNSSVEIFYRYTLEPGVQAGQVITNNMGASSPVENLVCSDENDGEVTDGDFGDGLYCTDPAQTTVTAGANFASRKWVAGTPELGWYNEITGELVPVGGGGCLSLEANGRTYTTNPCIAITNPGEPFHYVLRVENAGTESALEMTIIDNFPVSGDTGVFGADRGTQWENRPTLAGPATYNGPTTGVLEYSTSSDPCPGGPSDWPCDAAGWGSAPGADTASLRMQATFAPDLLPPGGVVDVYFSMTTPVEVPRVADPTIAYNSLAHGEVTDIGNGTPRELTPLEPLKVGVATMYGSFRMFKFVRENPGNLPLDDVEFEFTYECTLTNGTVLPQGTVTVTPTSPALVTGIPAGATCDVWETDANGGVPVATELSPVQVVIRPSLTPNDPTAGVAIGINDFPLGELEVLKSVTGFTDPAFTGGPYPVTVDCTFQSETVPGFPVDIELTWNGTEPVAVPVQAPVGSECTVTETEDNGATTVTYDPPGGVVTIPPEDPATVTVTITNDFPPGAVQLLKTVTGGVDPVFTPGPYTAELTCTFNGATLPGFPVVVELVPDEPSESFVAPVNSVCTVTETDDQGATTVTYDPASGSVTVPVGSDAEPISITITNDFPDGGLEVNKAIGENEAELDLDDLPYTFRYQCTFDPNPELEGDEIISPDPAGLLVATVNDPAEVTGLPAGAACEVWETIPGNQGGIPDATEENPAEVTIEAGTIVQPFTPVTVTNDYPSVPVELVKLVEGDAQEEFTGGPYTIRVNCWAADQIPGVGEPFPGFPLVVLVNANEPVGRELPVGTTCWFQEVGIPADVTVTYDPATPTGDAGLVVVPPEDPPDGTPVASVSVTNTFTTGSLVIEKTVSGPGAPAFSQGPFVFEVSCDYQGVEDVYSVEVAVPGSTDGSPVQSEPVTGLPIGAECTVTEIDNGGADIVTPPQTVTIEENEQANVAYVGVNNPFSAGSIAVVKQVDGTAADSDYVAGLEFTIAVECAVDENGTLVTVYDGEVTVAGDGEAVPVTDDDGEPALVPLGARCWGAEDESFGATAVTIDHDSYENGAEVVADAEGGVQPLQITVVNTFDTGELTISKEAVNAPNSNTAYEFTVTCTIAAADGTTTEVPLVDGTSPLSLGSGQSATVGTLAGARCRVVESDPGNAEVTIVESGGTAADDDVSDGIVTLDGDRTVAVTNTFPADEGGGGGGGFLPGTGSTVSSILVLAAVFVVTGIAAGLATRARRRPT